MTCRAIVKAIVLVMGMALVAGTAQASLIVSVTTDTGGSSVLLTPSLLSSTGGNFTLRVWADVVGTTTTQTDEKLLYLFYSVKSTAAGGGAVQSGAGVGVTSATLDSKFNGGTNQVGKIQDINADGIADLGAIPKTSATSDVPNTDFALPYSSIAPTQRAGGGLGSDGGVSITNGWRWLVEEVTYHIGDVVLGDGTTTVVIQLPGRKNGTTKAATWTEDNLAKTSIDATYLVGTSVTFSLEATAVTANAGGPYSVHYGVDGTQVNPLNGSGAVTAGFGVVSTKKWDLNGDGIFETVQSNGSIPVTYKDLKDMGYQYNTAKAATFQYTTNDGKTATAVAMVTIMPDTVVAADAGGPYTVDKGTDGELVSQLHGLGMVTSGDGVILSKMWDLDGNGDFETAQIGDFLNVTYNILEPMGYVVNVAKEAAFRVVTDTNVSSTGSGSITLLPEPATMALLGLGGLALAIRRRRAA